MGLLIRPLVEADLNATERVFRLAFGTFIGLSDPLQFAGDADPIRTRWRTDPASALGAELDGRLVGSNFLARWGSVGLFGPLTVHPDFWSRGIAQALLQESMHIFASWGVEHMGLFTYSESPKHIALYQQFGFWPRFLTAILSTRIEPEPIGKPMKAVRFSRISVRDKALHACRELTESIYSGLDLRREIISVHEQRLGDTLLFFDAEKLTAFAVCHCGRGTEAGTGTCYIKFAAVEAEHAAGGGFDELLQNCERFAASQGLEQLVAGVNTARHRAYALMLARKYRIFRLGVAMQRPDSPSYNRDNVYVIDDWR